MLDLMFTGRHLTLDSPLSAEEAAQRLNEDLAEPVWRVVEDRPHAFVGTFADGRFHMARLVRGRNSLRPTIDGSVSPAPHGCRIDVRLRLAPVGVVAQGLCLAIGGTMWWFAMPIVAAMARRPTPVVTDAMVLACVGLLLAPIWLVAALLVPEIEARKATRLLGRVFGAAPRRATAAGA